jgi:hypothetical protein
MREANDWRLTNQGFYLTGAKLFWSKYSPPDPANDHDHCEFCFGKFMTSEPDALHDGWCTEDRYRWVCSACCEDFRDLFNWQLCST